MIRPISLAVLAIGCAPAVPRVAVVASSATHSSGCDRTREASLVEEARFRREQLSRMASAERVTYSQTGELDGMRVDCPELPILEPSAGAHRAVHDPDEIVFETAACAELAGRPRDAISRYEMLRALYPRSKLVLHATRRVADLYSRGGSLRGAAARLEEYARRFAGEMDAPDALADAAAYRAVLGDDPARREDEAMFDRDFGRRERAGVQGNLRERRLLECPG